MGPVFTSRPVQPPEFTRCTVVAEDPHPFEFSKSVGSRAGVRDGSLFVEHAACDACRRLRPVDGRHSGHVAQALHPRIHLFGRLDSRCLGHGFTTTARSRLPSGNGSSPTTSGENRGDRVSCSRQSQAPPPGLATPGRGERAEEPGARPEPNACATSLTRGEP